MRKEEVIQEIKNKYKKISFFKRLFSWKYIIDIIISKIDKIDSNDNSNLDLLEQQKNELQEKNNILSQQIGIYKNEHDDVKVKIDDLHRIFNRTSGDKGKISELRLKKIIEDSSLGDKGNLWDENILIGKNRVEFALRTSKDNKWIPVDSKSLIPKEYDEENKEFIIDDNYIRLIKTESKNIQKYISQKNTESFALMVLPSDDIFMTLSEKYPHLFSEILKDGIYITSPNIFMQFCFTIYHLNDKLDQINKSSQILKELQLILKHMKSFHSNVKTSVEKINIAFETNLKDSEKKLIELEKNEVEIIE